MTFETLEQLNWTYMYLNKARKFKDKSLKMRYNISRNINTETRHGIQLLPNMNTIHRLLFADDVILVSDSVTGLQNKLNQANQGD